ncbi:MAG: glycosyltransferase family 4 protein [Candidatus Helarchaeota archaeon]
MNIGMILNKKFPPDIRVEKEARALVKGGFNVCLLCERKKGQPIRERLNGLKIHRGPNISGFIKRKVDFWLTHFTFINLFWRSYIRRFVIENDIDIIHIHDLLISNTVLKSIRDLNIPIVIDLHENYPAALLEWQTEEHRKRKLIENLFFDYNQWTKREASICRRVDAIIVVVDEMMERLVNTYNISAKKITVITNTEDPDFIFEGKIDAKIINQYNNKFVLSYIGGFGAHRGLDTAIKGMSFLKKVVPEALLLLVGKGTLKMEKKLRTLIAINGVQNNVVIKSWQPFEKVLSYMKGSSIGLIPHNSNEHTENTVPHKLFQYMMANIPILASSCKPLKRIVESKNCGLVFEAGNPKDFARKAEELYKNKSLRKRLALNGLNATLRGELNWTNTGKKLVNFYRRLELKHDTTK